MGERVPRPSWHRWIHPGALTDSETIALAGEQLEKTLKEDSYSNTATAVLTPTMVDEAIARVERHLGDGLYEVSIGSKVKT
jgi:hypothetical protein